MSKMTARTGNEPRLPKKRFNQHRIERWALKPRGTNLACCAHPDRVGLKRLLACLANPVAHVHADTFDVLFRHTAAVHDDIPGLLE